VTIRTTADLVRRRLANQKLATSTLRSPADVVAWLGAVQAQDYSAARWALGLRVKGLTDAVVEQAFNDGAILRTHVMRPTWHFVAPADIRWLQALTAPRVHALNRYYAHKNGLDDKTLARSRRVIERALGGGHQRTRDELGAALGKAGIPADGQRLAYLMMNAELDQVICSGARRGKQFTYALLDERAPKAHALPRDEALAELTRRYFTSHGPATLKDYAWWSGLTMSDARRGTDIVGRALVKETFGELTCWSSAPGPAFTRLRPSAHLLPIFDEYLIAYKDRGAVANPEYASRIAITSETYCHYLIVDGRLVGTWKRDETPTGIDVKVVDFQSFPPAYRKAIAVASDRYRAFLGKPVTVRDVAGGTR
jgi:hypothetical protein